MANQSNYEVLMQRQIIPYAHTTAEKFLTLIK